MERTPSTVQLKIIGNAGTSIEVWLRRRISAAFWRHFGSTLAVFRSAEYEPMNWQIWFGATVISFVWANLPVFKFFFLFPSTFYFLRKPYLHTYVICPNLEPYLWRNVRRILCYLPPRRADGASRQKVLQAGICQNKFLLHLIEEKRKKK